MSRGDGTLYNKRLFYKLNGLINKLEDLNDEIRLDNTYIANIEQSDLQIMINTPHDFCMLFAN